LHAFSCDSNRSAKTAASANLPIGTLDKSLSMWVFISPWASVTDTPAPPNGFTYANINWVDAQLCSVKTSRFQSPDCVFLFGLRCVIFFIGTAHL
jgi:hypothetical protein